MNAITPMMIIATNPVSANRANNRANVGSGPRPRPSPEPPRRFSGGHFADLDSFTTRLVVSRCSDHVQQPLGIHIVKYCKRRSSRNGVSDHLV
jgi:hypothetical protein